MTTKQWDRVEQLLDDIATATIDNRDQTFRMEKVVKELETSPLYAIKQLLEGIDGA